MNLCARCVRQAGLLRADMIHMGFGAKNQRVASYGRRGHAAGLQKIFPELLKGPTRADDCCLAGQTEDINFLVVMNGRGDTVSAKLLSPHDLS